MSKEHVRAWVWVGVFFLAAWGLLMPQRAAAHTWWCEANGGTHTCEAPVDIKWIPTGQSPYDPDHPVVGPFFDTAQDAIDYGMPDVLANCGVCTDTAVLSDTWGASIIEKKIWPDVFDDNVPAYLILQAYWVPVPGNTYNGIYVPTGRPSRFYCGDAGFGTLADDYVPYYYDFSCTQYPTPLSSDYVKYPICRAGLRPITDYDGAGGFDWENGTPNPGYDRFECVEPDDYNLTDGSCCDSASAEGVSIGGNPVQLSTGAKLDHVVDYTNASPFPITWERYYHSKKQVWSFGYQQSLFVFLSGAGFDQATLTRPDGTLIRFHRAATTHDPWTLNMGSNQSVRATFTEVLDSLGTSVDHYEYRTLSDTTETYSPDGKLQSVADRYGRKLTMTYPTTGSQVGLLSRIDDDAGRYLELTYGATDTYGRRYVESVTDGDKIISYAFTTGVGLAMDLPVYGFLTDVEQADGTLVSYMYGTYSEWGSVDYNFQRLTGIVDEDGNPYASYQYDYFGRVIEEHHGTSAQPFTYAYDTSAWSPLSSFTTMSWDGGSTTFDAGAVYSGLAKNSGSDERCAYCSGPEANAITYDAYGNPTAETDFNGVVTHRTYDTDRALKLTETEDVGGPLERTTTWTWNPDFRLPATREEPIETDAGAGTRTTTWAYDTNGTLLSETVAPDTGETARARFWTYNAQAEPLTATDARSHTTTYTYDTAFNLTSVEDPLAHTTTYGNYTLQGQAGTITDPNGLQTVITYDDRQRPTEIKRGTSGTHWETTTIAYAAIGKVHRIDLPNGFWAEYVYDDAHRLVEIDTALGRQLYTLDAMGHRTGTTTKDSGGTTLVSATATYGALGDLATSLDANSEETGYSYSDAGQLTGTLDPLTHTATRSYDALRRLHILTNENGEQATLAYDPSDGLVEVNDALGHTTTYHRNGFGEVVQIDSPDTGTTTVTRDANGNPLVTTDARGATATRTYDALDRVTQVVFAGPSMTTETQTFTYDSCTNGIGRLCSMTDQSGTTGYTYDLWGRVTGKAFVPAAAPSLTLSVGYGYDTAGRLTSVVYPSGKTLVQGWTAENLTSLTWDGTGVLSAVGYRPFGGGVTGWTWGGFVAAVGMSYDQNGRIAEIDANDVHLYDRDALGRITGIENYLSPGLDEAFTYDNVGRLTQANLASWAAPFDYTYDANGNRLTHTNGLGAGSGYETDWTLVGTSNRVASVVPAGGSSQTWSTDAAGNLTDDGAGMTLTYGPNGRMASSAQGSFSATYAVNALGQRTFKEVATSPGPALAKEFSVYDEQGRLLGRYDGSGAALEELVYLDGFRPVATVRGSDIDRVLSDHLGTPRKVLDPTGTLLWSWEAGEPFGNSAPVGVGGFTFDLRFPGQILDPETGLVHNGFREYHPGAGKYVESDPLGLRAGLNTFEYGFSSPLEIFDELGLSAKDVETLHNIFISELQKMTDAGQRYGEVSEITPVWERSWNNSMGMIGRGAPYMDCKAQTVEMISRIRRYALDDQWMLTPDSALGHTWGVAISNNPSDPPVWFDTRASNMSVGKPCSTCIGWGGFFTKGSNFGTAGTPGNIPGKSKK